MGGKSFVSYFNACIGLIKVIVDHRCLTSRVIKRTVICHLRYRYLEKKIIMYLSFILHTQKTLTNKYIMLIKAENKF